MSTPLFCCFYSCFIHIIKNYALFLTANVVYYFLILLETIIIYYLEYMPKKKKDPGN